ncbi:sensor histidine kinase [Streptomyces brevispora]|uniref:sensor histidine kinase n=1 Tax=Streptomyces brevispora TaxID=887462 RepID=UPI00371E4C4E
MPFSFQRYLRDHPRVADAIMILVALVSTVSATVFGTFGVTTEEVNGWPGLILSVIACAALWWHRSRPRTVVVVTGMCGIVACGLGYLPTVLLLAPAVAALYTFAARTKRRTANMYGLAVVTVLVPAAVLSGYQHASWPTAALNPAVSLMLSVAAGSAARLRRAYLDSLHTRAELAEATREQEARQRVAEERVRIARELHDVVAHHLALANAQAGTAARLVRRNPEQAERLITDLAGTTSSALRELKATVGLLRGPEESDSPLEPSPGLARLPDLVARYAATGLEVTVTTVGDERPLAPGVDLTAFRIVQEALTNVTKHAGTSTAQVQLIYAGNLLTIKISDRGGSHTRPAFQVSGYGLMGMRERAESAGGRFTAGRRPDGGFLVTAELPFHF